MNIIQNPELYWAAATAVFTSLLWMPHILQRVIEMGPFSAFRDPRHDVATQAPWAQRAIRAHTNAVENLAGFGILAIILVITGTSTAITASAAAFYFWSRVVHYIVYITAIPWARTPVYILGLACQLVMAATIFGWL